MFFIISVYNKPICNDLIRIKKLLINIVYKNILNSVIIENSKMI